MRFRGREPDRTPASWLAVCAAVAFLTTFSHAWAEPPTRSESELSRAIGDRIDRVPEFKFIQEEARRLGVRAWLFGGTAAGFGHYVNWDLARERGDSRFQPDRFDYDFANIYRSTQDLDIVIDGTREQAQKLQAELQTRYPHQQGPKSAWELRLLREPMGPKQALLNNSDYLNQHTDSNSTGMIELTPPPSGEARIRDLRAWNSAEPQFLRDLRDSTIHYHFSPLHETTSFYKEGRNPPIVSVVRYLTKAFQYELKIPPEDLATIRKIVDEFDPAIVFKNDYLATWFGWNGKKLIQNAVNLEYAIDTLDQLGLRKKLRELGGDVNQPDTLAWWMNREPLRTRPLASTGKTARELFEERGWAKPGEPLVVAHEANSYLAYESIARAHTGDPNVLTSREGIYGEAANFGEGFYTRVGREGARGTGMTVRFTVTPDAREGADFTVHDAGIYGHYLTFKNKAAFRVIPESLNLTPLELFEALNRDGIAQSDRGLLERLRRRIDSKALSPKEEEELVRFVLDHPTPKIVSEWLTMKLSEKRQDVTHSLLRNADSETLETILKNFARRPGFVLPNEWGDLIVERLDPRQFGLLINACLEKPQYRDNPRLGHWFTRMVERGRGIGDQSFHISLTHLGLKNPSILLSDPKLMPLLIENTPWLGHFTHMMQQKGWGAHPELIKAVVQRHDPNFHSAIVSLLKSPEWKDNPALLRLTGGEPPTADNLRAAFARGTPTEPRCTAILVDGLRRLGAGE